MNIRIHTQDSTSEPLSFSIANIDVSVINALRRTLLTDIEIWGMHNKIKIANNTSKLTNEILQNRISCIPVHIPIESDDAPELEISLHVVNDTGSVMVVTSQDFIITHKQTGEILSTDQTRAIFPPDPITGDFIDIVRLRPEIATIQGKTIAGEELHITCELEKVTSAISAMFNAVSLSTLWNTEDKDRQPDVLAQRQQEWQQEGRSPVEIERETKNWWLLDAKRVFIPNSFEFAVESVGIYTNYELMRKACDVIMQSLNDWTKKIDDNTLIIMPSNTTLTNGFDITVDSGNSTIGNLMNNKLYAQYYQKKKYLTYCAYGKFHPHNDTSTIRIAAVEEPTILIIHTMLKTCISEIENQIKSIRDAFNS